MSEQSSHVARALHLHSLESLCADLMRGLPVLTGRQGAEFFLASDEAPRASREMTSSPRWGWLNYGRGLIELCSTLGVVCGKDAFSAANARLRTVRSVSTAAKAPI